MENKQNKQLLAIGITFVIFVIIIALVYFLFFYGNKERALPLPGFKFSKEVEKIDNEKKEIKYVEPKKIESREMTKPELENFVMSFSERFGTYSNQADFNNITTLQPSMTDRMRAWSEKYVKEKRLENKSNKVYYGVITKAIALETIRYEDELGEAEFLVKTRRKSSFASKDMSDDAFGQNIEVVAKKIDGIWKIDEAFWQERD